MLFVKKYIEDFIRDKFGNKFKNLISFNFRIGRSTNNINISISNTNNKDFKFWTNVSFKCNKKNKSFSIDIKELSLKDVSTEYIKDSILISDIFNLIFCIKMI